MGWGHRGVRGCGALCCGFGGARVVWVWDPHSCGVLCGFGVLLDVVCHGFGVPVDVVCCAMGLGSPWIWCIVWVWGPHGCGALCHGFVGSPWMWCIVPQVCGVPMGVVPCTMSLWGPHGCYVLWGPHGCGLVQGRCRVLCVCHGLGCSVLISCSSAAEVECKDVPESPKETEKSDPGENTQELSSWNGPGGFLRSHHSVLPLQKWG